MGKTTRLMRRMRYKFSIRPSPDMAHQTPREVYAEVAA